MSAPIQELSIAEAPGARATQARHLPKRLRRRRSSHTRVALIAAVTVLATAISTLLASTPANAAGYIYHVGHPMYFGGPNSGGACTGGYAVSGASGMFVTTAGHCSTNANGNGTTGAIVYGVTRRFGTIIRNDFRVTTPQTFDAALVRLDPGDDAYQIVVDPITGRSPGDGRVRGYYGNSALTPGFLIGKMGRTSGWTEGRVTGWFEVTNGVARERVVCTTALASPGDSGGPVWRVDSNGVMAIGIVTLRSRVDGSMCFKTIEDTLRQFGAWLPVFARNNVLTNQPGAAQVVTEPAGPPLPTDPKPLSDGEWQPL